MSGRPSGASRDLFSGQRRPVLADVAHLAGVSPQSVSRVLRGQYGHAESTRRRVIAAVTALGYEADGTAQELALRRAGTLPEQIRPDDHGMCADLLLLRDLATRLVRLHPLVEPLPALLLEVVTACDALTSSCECTSRGRS